MVGPHKQPEYLVWFKGYCPEDNLWLPQRNLEHVPDILKARPDRQTTSPSQPALSRAKQASSALRHMGHMFCYQLGSHRETVSEPRGEECEATPSQLASETLHAQANLFFKFTSAPLRTQLGTNVPQGQNPAYLPKPISLIPTHILIGSANWDIKSPGLGRFYLPGNLLGNTCSLLGQPLTKF